MKFGFRSTFKSLFNVKSWIGWHTLSQNGSWISQMVRGLAKVPQKNQVSETFAEACEKYGYTEEFLMEQADKFQLAARIYLVFLGIGVAYLGWLFIHQHYAASIVMLPINFMLFSLFFRESFWLMQIKQRRLGMTMREWFNIVVFRNES